MIIESASGHDLATELHTRLFGPLGMTKTYLPLKPPEGIKGPHGHGYYPDANGRVRDVDRFNASIAGAAGGVVSTAQDMSAFKRAMTQGKLLPPAFQRVLTDPLPNDPHPSGKSDGPCVDDFKIMGGTIAGYLAMTIYSDDGRRQLSIRRKRCAGITP